MVSVCVCVAIINSTKTRKLSVPRFIALIFYTTYPTQGCGEPLEARLHLCKIIPIHQAFQPRGKQSSLSLRGMFENVCNLCLFLLINSTIFCAFLFYVSSDVLYAQKTGRERKLDHSNQYHIYMPFHILEKSAYNKGWHKREN